MQGREANGSEVIDVLVSLATVFLMLLPWSHPSRKSEGPAIVKCNHYVAVAVEGGRALWISLRSVVLASLFGVGLGVTFWSGSK